MRKSVQEIASEFGRLGGSRTSEAKAGAARLNGQLGGRPRTKSIENEDQMRTAIARLQRARLLKSSIEVLLTSDAEDLRASEIRSLERSAELLEKVIERLGKVQLQLAPTA